MLKYRFHKRTKVRNLVFIFVNGFTYLFFEFSASLIVWSFSTVTTIGDIKYLSGQLVSFIMCFSANNFLSSLLTLSCRLKGMRLPFWCLGCKCL